MKLSDHVEHLRQLIDNAFRNGLGRMGYANNQLSKTTIEAGLNKEQARLNNILETFQLETGNPTDAFEKLVEELTFTFFNRIAALKVMEAHTLHPEIITKNSIHGDRSFAHKMWLESNPDRRTEELEGLGSFFEAELAKLAKEIPLFSLQHPYHLLPTAFELSGIINAFNQVETDTQVEEHIWKSDDVLGWLYESYNNYKKAAHKASGDKTEYNKVSIQSQVYTPRWVVQFLVDNSLGKLYLEMYPDSAIKNKYKIAPALSVVEGNHPTTQVRERKPLHEIRMIDPSTGSGNYLLYGFDVYYDLYIDQIENYGADYNEADIPKLIIENNLHGVDLDDRAIQLAQLGLYIKAKRKKRTAKLEHFNIVSSDFFLPAYAEVKNIFEDGNVGERERKIIEDVWEDLQNAHKFGSLIRLEEKLNLKWFGVQKAEPKGVITMFGQENLDNFETFRTSFFTNLQTAVAQNTAKQGQTFLNTKTQDAITFLQLLTQKYDVAVANPPYTDSSDFGPELKKFIDANYKQPLKFNSNLYVTFIKKCFDLTTENGYIAMIHPFSFMFIKTFEDVRKLIIEKTHIELLVDFGLDRVNLFDGGYASAPTFYILSKEIKNKSTAFFKLTDGLQERDKKHYFEIAFNDYLAGKSNERLFILEQDKLKIIKTWPFVYWITDNLRSKFEISSISNTCPPKSGLATSNNERFLRFWWELYKEDISTKVDDSVGWKFYAKGGNSNKWYGNLWLCVNWKNEAIEMRNTGRAVFRNEEYYFKKGITYSALGSGSFRLLPENSVYDVGGASLFPLINTKLEFILGLLNSKFAGYIINCLNPTVNTQVGDIERIPFVVPSKNDEMVISNLADVNVEIKKQLCSYRVIETNFNQSSLLAFQGTALKDRVFAYLNFENAQHTQVLINEAIINELIFEVYELSDADREQVETKMGLSIGSLPVLHKAKDAFLAQLENPIAEVKAHIQNLSTTIFDEQQIREIKEGFATLYQSNNDLEEFCIRNQVNPINVWYWFKETGTVPAARAAEIGLEFLADAFRTILMEDEDGIVPLVALPGEPKLYERFEKYCYDQGFNDAQIMQLDGLLARPVYDYIEQHFFKNLSDHLNLFMYLPKTPFIWHLSSGELQGFEVYIIIYKWNADSLYKLKSTYISQRIDRLNNRLVEISNTSTGQAQSERELIEKQKSEIKAFEVKLDDLIASGYNPKLDDGVGKNIAPLQVRGMLKAEVLKTNGGAKSQLNKYLNADW